MELLLAHDQRRNFISPDVNRGATCLSYCWHLSYNHKELHGGGKLTPERGLGQKNQSNKVAVLSTSYLKPASSGFLSRNVIHCISLLVRKIYTIFVDFASKNVLILFLLIEAELPILIKHIRICHQSLIQQTQAQIWPLEVKLLWWGEKLIHFCCYELYF